MAVQGNEDSNVIVDLGECSAYNTLYLTAGTEKIIYSTSSLFLSILLSMILSQFLWTLVQHYYYTIIIQIFFQNKLIHRLINFLTHFLVVLNILETKFGKLPKLNYWCASMTQKAVTFKIMVWQQQNIVIQRDFNFGAFYIIISTVVLKIQMLAGDWWPHFVR